MAGHPSAEPASDDPFPPRPSGDDPRSSVDPAASPGPTRDRAAAFTITIPRFWSRPRPAAGGSHALEPGTGRGRRRLPGRPAHRIGAGTAAVLVAALALALVGDSPLIRTELDSHPAGTTTTTPSDPLAAGLPTDPGMPGLTLAPSPTDLQAAGAPIVSIPGPTVSPDLPTGAPAQPTAQAVTLPAAAPAAPLPVTPTVGQSAAPRQLSGSGIPARAQAAYTTAATRMATLAPTCRLPWTLLAAIGRVESDHARTGRSTLIASSGRAHPAIYGVRLDGTTPGTAVIRDTDRGTLDADPAYDRAVGPLQFLPATWRAFALDGDGDRAADPQDLDDAALTAARYLCTGATPDLSTAQGQWNAAYRYNRSTSYANLVLALATTYATGRPATVVTPPAGATTAVPTITLTITPAPAVTRTLTPTASTTPSTSPTGASTATITTTSGAGPPPAGSTVTVTVTVITVTVTPGGTTTPTATTSTGP